MAFRIIVFSCCFLLFSCARSQEKSDYRLVGGACEGCEAVFEYKGRLKSVDTLPEFTSAEKKLKVSGVIYQEDGKTPAKDVVLYIHHTNAEGVYPTKGNEKGWADRHGYLRGWIKTDKDGRYTFYTQRYLGVIPMEVTRRIFTRSSWILTGDIIIYQHTFLKEIHC